MLLAHCQPPTERVRVGVVGGVDQERVRLGLGLGHCAYCAGEEPWMGVQGRGWDDQRDRAASDCPRIASAMPDGGTENPAAEHVSHRELGL